MNKYCQSCGMPMKMDPQKGGTNKDGSLNAEYCSYCYKDGEFTFKCETAAEMQKMCIDIMVKEKHFPKILAWLFTRCIPKLKRWK